MKNKKLGVIVGRFQVPELTTGHKFLINKVLEIHDEVAIGIGSSSVRGTKRDPIPYEIRKKIISKCFPKARIFRIDDHESDYVWSKNLDLEISLISSDAVIYGSRDCFLPHYKGSFTTLQLEPEIHISGTTAREFIYINPLFKNLKDFASGIVYSTQDQFPRIFMCVDIACIRRPKEGVSVLVGKKYEKEKWRFPGGFVDPGDLSLEVAAKRELYEEVDVSIEGRLEYLGSFAVDDWRYRRTDDKIMTAFFLGEYTFGSVFKAKDDLFEAKWIPLKDLHNKNFHESHRVLLKKLKEVVKEKKWTI